MQVLIRYILLCVLSGILCYCASPISPTGGSRDEQAPRLDSTAYSTPNYQVNFEKQTIELTFDEWVQLNNPNTQVLVSPPLEFRPTVRLKKRTVLFEFDEKEQLRDSATYTINFGEAVQDLTEKNPAEDLRFVFSTGPYVDSLKITGVVIDARTNEAVRDVRVMLYDNLADSVVRTERPFYFAKTDEAGNFSVENVRAGTFKLFALEDANLNYRFDQITERIAIIEKPLDIADNTADSLLLRLFQPEIPPQILDTENSSFGRITITFNDPPEDIVFSPIDGPDTLIYEYEMDSIKVWYPESSPADSLWSLIVQSGEDLKDTIQTEVFPKEEWMSRALLMRRGAGSPEKSESINPDRNVRISLIYPVASWDTSRIELLEDSIQTRVIPSIRFDSIRIRDLVFDYDWKEETIYQLRILPGGVNDIYGLTNQDTILQNYQVSPRKSFGILSLKMLDVWPDSAYLIEILQNEKEVIETFRINGVTEWERQLVSLPTGNYSIRVTLDLNSNGKWDTGDYDANRLPEPILLEKLGNLRANWEVEAEVSLMPDKFNVPIRKGLDGQGRGSR